MNRWKDVMSFYMIYRPQHAAESAKVTCLLSQKGLYFTKTCFIIPDCSFISLNIYDIIIVTRFKMKAVLEILFGQNTNFL